MKVSKSEIAKWMKDEVEFLRKNDSYNGSYLRLDGYTALVICWEGGFGDEKRDDVIQSTSEPDYALCYSLREVDSNSDFNNIEDWKYASNDDLGIECESSSIIGEPNDEYFNKCADYIIDEYNELNGLGEKKEEVKESVKSNSKNNNQGRKAKVLENLKSLKESMFSGDVNKDFLELLWEMEFKLVKNNNGTFSLYDMQGANLGDIQSEEFISAKEILDRLEGAYIHDYFLGDEDLEEIEDEDYPEDGFDSETFAKWYTPKMRKKYPDLEYRYEICDFIANKSKDVDLEKAIVKQNVNESKDKLNEGTSNFKSLGNLPLLVFSIEDNELDEEGDIVTLDNFEVEDLRDRLDSINDYLKDKQYELSDEIYDLEMKDSLSDEEDKRLDELKDIDGAFEDLHFDIEDGHYAGCQITTSYPKSFDKLPKDVQKEVLRRLKDIKRDFNLTQLEVSNVFSNGETIYDKVDENRKSIKENSKPLNEGKSEFRSIIGKHFNYNVTDKFIDIVVDILSGIDDFNDQEAIELTLDLDDSLIYYSNQWEVMMHYQSPSEANLDEAILSLYNDVEEICKEIASGKNESLNEELDVSLTIEEMFWKVNGGKFEVFDKDGHFTLKAIKLYNKVASQYPTSHGGEDAFDSLCKEQECFKEGVKKSAPSRKSIQEDAKSGERVNVKNVREWLKSGGATIDAKTGKAINFNNGYEISLKGSEKKFTKLNLGKDEDVQKVVDGVKSRLNRQGVDAVGLWVNNGIVYLDNSIHFIGSEEEALERGRKEEQLSILRWKDMAFLDCNANKNVVPTKSIEESWMDEDELKDALEELGYEELSNLVDEFSSDCTGSEIRRTREDAYAIMNRKDVKANLGGLYNQLVSYFGEEDEDDEEDKEDFDEGLKKSTKSIKESKPTINEEDDTSMITQDFINGLSKKN